MRILVNIKELEIGVAPLEELQEDLVRFLHRLYNDSTDDDEAYLIDEWDKATLGRDSPKPSSPRLTHGTTAFAVISSPPSSRFTNVKSQLASFP